MTTLPATHPVATTHIIRKAAMFTTALAVTSAGMWFGAQAVTAHMNQPASNVSYANQDAITRTLRGANHNPRDGWRLPGRRIHSDTRRGVRREGRELT